MLKGFKSGALFIGTVIGAGFASGREIALFFNGKSSATALLAGLFLGAMCYVFMTAGRLCGQRDLNGWLFGRKAGKVFRVIMYFSTISVFIAMFCGAELVIYQTFNLKYFGLITTAVCIICAVFGLENVKTVNAVIVPAIVVLIALIFFRGESFYTGGSLGLSAPSAYCAMNMLPAGYVMAEAGKTSRNREIISASVFSGIIFAVMLYMIRTGVSGREDQAMPLFEAARAYGLETFGGLLIYSAVFTTQLSAVNVLMASPFAKKNRIAGALALLAGGMISSAIFTFQTAVNTLYPPVSFFGVVLTLAGTIKIIVLKYGTASGRELPMRARPIGQ